MRASARALTAVLALALPFALTACRSRSHRPPKLSATTPAGSASAVPAPLPENRSGPPAAEIDLSRGAPELAASGLLAPPGQTFADLIEALDELHEKDAPKGIFVRFGTGRMGFARSAEVARGLRSLRDEGKRVFCHADELTHSSYGLAAAGCDRIWLSPAAQLETVGIATELIFVKDLLARFGVEADVLQVGKYKGTGEMLTRNEASAEHKESLVTALGDIRAQWLDSVLRGRSGARGTLSIEHGPYTAEEAKREGFIDEVGYADDARDSLRREVGAGPVEAFFGSHATAHGGGGLVDLVRSLSGAKRPGAHSGSPVAVLRASGAITMEASRSLLGGGGGIDARSLTKELRALAHDDGTKVVVLRIDSPGGSALASDLLWHELMLVRKKKPLVISIGDMAASGGYYMACAGTKIVAEDASIVGSIGVVGGKLAFGNALRPYGVHTEIVPADPSMDPARAAYLSTFTPWDEGTRARVLATMTSTYDLFVRRVAEGRGTTGEAVGAFAEGRIFSGRDGLKRGMVDQLGGLEDAIVLAKREAGLDDDAGVRFVSSHRGFFEQLGLGDDEDDSEARAARSLLVATIPRSADLAPFAGSLAPLLAGERALVAMPFAFLID